MKFEEYLGVKNSESFPYEASLSCVVDELLIEVFLFQETSPALKNPWLRA